MLCCQLGVTRGERKYFIDKQVFVLYDPPLSNSSQVEQMCWGASRA
jgi:hypothetical protein